MAAKRLVNNHHHWLRRNIAPTISKGEMIMRILKSWPVSESRIQVKSVYDKVLDGKVYELERGKDFEGPVQGMRMNLYSAAKQRRVKIHTHKIDNSHLAVQAIGKRRDGGGGEQTM